MFIKKSFTYTLILLFFVICITACFSIKIPFLKKETKIEKNIFLKKYCLAIFENRSSFTKQKYLKTFYEKLALDINQNLKNAYLVSEESSDFTIIKNIPRNLSKGTVDNQALAQMGREMGLNSIITGEIIEIKTFSAKKGFIGFRKIRPGFSWKVKLSIYDCETGFKTFFEDVEQKSFVDDKQFYKQYLESNKSTKFQLLIQRSFEQMALTCASMLTKSLNKELWKSYIIRKTSDLFEIPCGSSSNIQVGNTFNVIEKLDNIVSEGQEYIIPGEIIGKVEVVEVFKDSCKAKKISGENIENSSCVIR